MANGSPAPDDDGSGSAVVVHNQHVWCEVGVNQVVGSNMLLLFQSVCVCSVPHASDMSVCSLVRATVTPKGQQQIQQCPECTWIRWVGCSTSGPPARTAHSHTAHTHAAFSFQLRGSGPAPRLAVNCPPHTDESCLSLQPRMNSMYQNTASCTPDNRASKAGQLAQPPLLCCRRATQMCTLPQERLRLRAVHGP